MILESAIGPNSRVGEYLVQSVGRPLVRVQVLTGGNLVRASPETDTEVKEMWDGQWMIDSRIEVGQRWYLTVQMLDRVVEIRADLGVVESIEVVELSIDGPVTPSSSPGKYEVRTHSELVVVLIGETGCRAAHGRLINGLGSAYEGDGRMHEAENFIFTSGYKGALTWSEDPDSEECNQFSTSEVYRIDWWAPRRSPK